MNDELLRDINNYYNEHYRPHLDLVVKDLLVMGERLYVTHMDSNVIALFPKLG